MVGYRNPWHTPGKPEYGPAAYQTDANPEEYRGHLIYRRLTVCWDVVRDGVCIGQYAGPRGARDLIDLIHDNPGDWWAQRALKCLEPAAAKRPAPPRGASNRSGCPVADEPAHETKERP